MKRQTKYPNTIIVSLLITLVLMISCEEVGDNSSVADSGIKIYRGDKDTFTEYSQADSELTVTIFPNPFSNVCGIRIKGFGGQNVEIWISDETGILTKWDYYLDEDEILLVVDFSYDTTDGIYICDIIIGDTIWRYDLIKKAN